MTSSRKELIFEELVELVPISEKAEQQYEMYSMTIQHPKFTVPADDQTFEIITKALTDPSTIPMVKAGEEKADEEEDHDYYIKQSYRLMTYIVKDVEEAKEMLKHVLSKHDPTHHIDDDIYMKYLINPTRAGLLAKQIFAAYRSLLSSYENNSYYENNGPKPHIPHLNKILSTILDAFPTQVVGASCVGGSKGVDQSLYPMLHLHEYVAPKHSPLFTMKDLINLGCTGRKKDEQLTLQQQQQQQQMAMLGQPPAEQKVYINHGHRRKFVLGLAQAGILEQCFSLIKKDVTCAEDVSDVLMEAIEYISFPPMLTPGLTALQNKNGKSKNDESVGEEALLAKIATTDNISLLFSCFAVDDNSKKLKASDEIAVSSALLGLFELATGKARRQLETPVAPVTVSEDDDGLECKASDDVRVHAPGIDDNKMVKAGITDKMHAVYCEEMKSLVKSLDIYSLKGNATDDDSGVRHPGRYTIAKPFTSNRLQLLILFTDLVSYESHYHGVSTNSNSNYEEKLKHAIRALDIVMELPVKAAPPKNSDEAPAENLEEDDTIYNPWPGICDALFMYPENNMLQVQFYRLIHALCATNHEATLKLVVQKCKFVSRAIKECKLESLPSTRGVLLRCLNALRLHSQSISPNSFLRHYLESHDGWKGFLETLRKTTLEHERKGGGIAVPLSMGDDIKITAHEDINIDLGSSFAADLGFPSSITAYVESVEDSVSVVSGNASTAGSPKKKKKKSKKGKKKK